MNGNTLSFKYTNPIVHAVMCGLVLTFLVDATAQAACTPAPTGLIDWWRAEGNASDSVGGNDGTVFGNLVYDSGEVGQGFVFDNQTSYILLPSSPSLDVGANGTGLTIECWIKPNAYDVTVEGAPIVEWDSANNDGVDFWSGGNLFALIKSTSGVGGGVLNSPVGILSTNTWQHVALTYDKQSGTAYIYYNGVQVATNSNIGNITPLTTYPTYRANIGRRTGQVVGLNDTYGGSMDELAIYNRALSPSEIQAIFTAGSAGKCEPVTPPACTPAPTGLLDWWQAEGNALDAVGANNGTVFGNLVYDAGEVGQGFVFDNQTSYVLLPSSPSLDVGANGTGLTIECWIKPNAYDVTIEGAPIVEWDSANNDGVDFWSGGNLFALIKSTSGVGGGVLNSPVGILSTNTWQHVALTYDKQTGTAYLYRNGVAVATNSNIGNITPLTTYPTYRANIGRRTGQVVGLNDTYGGSMDELAIYNRALSASELQAIFVAGSAGKCAPVPPTECAPPPSGLVSWWRGENNGQDAAGNNDGTLTGGVGFGGGEVGQAFRLNGTNAAVAIPAAASLNVGLGAGLTVEGWINPADVADQHPILEWNDGNGYGVHLWTGVVVPYGTGPGCLYANIVSGNDSHIITSAPGVVVTNVWQHVAVTYDKAAGQAVLYLNGAVVAQQNLGSFTPLTTFNLYLGKRPANGPTPAFYWAGLLDELSLYDHALTPGEIQAIFAAGSAGKCPPVTPPTCTPAPSDLISWWPAEGNGLDVVSGYNGVLTNGAGFGVGKVGQAFSFNGSNALWITNMTSLTLSNYSIEAWINPTAQPDNLEHQGIIFGQSYGLAELFVRSSGANVKAVLVIGVPAFHYEVVSTNELPLGQWSHVVGTWDGASSKMRIYVNGVLQGEATSGLVPPISTRPFYIGGHALPSSGVEFFKGLIDETSLYGRTLSGAEIAALYNAGSAGKCVPATPPTCTPAPSGLLDWWRAEGNALDSVGSNNGTVFGNLVYDAGEVGQGFVFDNQTSYILLPSSPSLDVGANGTGLTIECWIKPNAYDVTIEGAPIVEWDSDSNDGVDFWSGGDLFALIKSTSGVGGGLMHSPPGILSTNTWQHVALTYDKQSGTAYIYYNGARVATNSNIGNITPLTTYPTYRANIGRRTGQPVGLNDTYGGSMDELAIYNRALSPSEIQAVFAAGSAGKCEPVTPPCIGNHPPVAGPDRIKRFPRFGTRVNTARLLSNDTDADHDPLTITGVSPHSRAGGTVQLAGKWICYTPPRGYTNVDSFTYTLSDGHCGPAVLGTVTVDVRSANPAAENCGMDRHRDGSVWLQFEGMPGCAYHIQYTDSLLNPNWHDLGCQFAGDYGDFEITNVPPANVPARFYRVVGP